MNYKKAYTKKNPYFAAIPKFINLYKVMTIQIEETHLRNSFRASHLYREFLSASLFDHYLYNFDLRDKSDFCMFYGKTFFRKDHNKTFINFSSNFENADRVFSATLQKKKIHFLRFVIYQCLALIWMCQLLFTGHRLRESFSYLYYLFVCRETIKMIEKTPWKKYKFVVVYYDLVSDENCFIQFYQHHGIPGLTLQHGIFSEKPIVKNISDTAIEFKRSISDYYLAWNQYTKEEAIIAGMDANKIVVLGIPKYATYKKTPRLSTNVDNCFGIVLNNKNFSFHNEQMIRIANEISHKTGLKFYMRYHPDLKGDEYQKIVGDGFAGNCNNNLTIEEYSKTVKFTIISSSSVFVDLVFLQHPVYRLVVSENDTYATVKLNSFKNADELLKLLMLKTHKDDGELFKYLCTDYYCLDNYKHFFRKLGEGK